MFDRFEQVLYSLPICFETNMVPSRSMRNTSQNSQPLRACQKCPLNLPKLSQTCPSNLHKHVIKITVENPVGNPVQKSRCSFVFLTCSDLLLHFLILSTCSQNFLCIPMLTTTVLYFPVVYLCLVAIFMYLCSLESFPHILNTFQSCSEELPMCFQRIIVPSHVFLCSH